MKFYSEVATRQMGIYGYCVVLKHLRENHAQRSVQSPALTQQSITGYSMMSQTFYNTQNNPQRNFDLLALEILGLLRKCFNQKVDIKETLYEGNKF